MDKMEKIIAKLRREILLRELPSDAVISIAEEPGGGSHCLTIGTRDKHITCLLLPADWDGTDEEMFRIVKQGVAEWTARYATEKTDQTK